MSFLEDALVKPLTEGFQAVDTFGGLLPSGTGAIADITGESGAKAAEEAAATQAQSQREALEFQKASLAELTPQRQLGFGAFREQAGLAGLDLGETQFLGQDFGAIEGREIGARDIPQFSISQGAQDAFRAPQQELGTFQLPRQELDAFQLPGGPTGPVGEDIQLTPGQRFLQQQAERALLRTAASTGQLGGGATKQALQEQAIGLGQQFLGEQEEQRRLRQQDEFQRLQAQERVRQERQAIGTGELTTEERIRQERQGISTGAAALEEEVRARREGVLAGQLTTEEDVRLRREAVERARDTEQFTRLGALTTSGLQVGQQGVQADIASGIQGLGTTAAAGQLSAAQAQAQGTQNTVGLGIGVLTALSDRRLKKNIKFKRMTPGGHKWYSFDYIWDEPSEGVMSDEVGALVVMKHASGYDMVNYAGVR